MHKPHVDILRAAVPKQANITGTAESHFAKHPRTTFIALHVANWPENLDAVSSWLDKYPKHVWEFGAREGQSWAVSHGRHVNFSRIPGPGIMFGTDSAAPGKMYPLTVSAGSRPRMNISIYWGYPGQGRWEIYGWQLPDSVLEKIYNKNAEKIFGQFKGCLSTELGAMMRMRGEKVSRVRDAACSLRARCSS